MGKLVVVNHMTLDGVMQAPARADEDTRGGFAHGGWATANNDEVMAATLGRRMAEGGGRGRGGLLLGRRTYEDFYAVWPSRTGDPVSDVLNRTAKYVVSRTLKEPLPWSNSVPDQRRPDRGGGGAQAGGRGSDRSSAAASSSPP